MTTDNDVNVDADDDNDNIMKLGIEQTLWGNLQGDKCQDWHNRRIIIIISYSHFLVPTYIKRK